MTREEALKAWEQMYSEIDKDNWLFIGTINPQMVEWAIKALADRKTEPTGYNLSPVEDESQTERGKR